MKKIVTPILILICMLTACNNNANKSIPETRLLIDLNGEKIHLVHIGKAHYYGGEEAVYFIIIRDELSERSKEFAHKDYSIFVEESYSLRFTQENNRFKLEKVSGDVTTPSIGEPPRIEWEDAGYSTDNTLWAKVFEYYLKHKDSIQ